LATTNCESLYNVVVRLRTTQFGALVAVGFLVGQGPVYAQHRVSVPADVPCQSFGNSESLSDYEGGAAPRISIADVAFSGALQMPFSEQVEISNLIKEKTYGASLENVVAEGIERAKAGWQDRGYFKVRASGEASTLNGSPVAQSIVLSIHITEGARYDLGGITFKNNQAIRKFRRLRGLFSIQDGDIFSREKIAKGLENLRKAYGNIGYINFTSIPETVFDEGNKLAFVEITFDEGKQFHVSKLNVRGLDGPARDELLKASPVKPGGVYREQDFDVFLAEHISLLNFYPDEPGHVDRHLNEKAGTIAITINAAPCVIQ
jgi:surface antigen-like variable number repeat protein